MGYLLEWNILLSKIINNYKLFSDRLLGVETLYKKKVINFICNFFSKIKINFKDKKSLELNWSNFETLLDES
jgi:hypothetical protein